ncbi:GNAT family N-acetyltransferase [Paractinoplanes rishiriensis]|uniref:N-acetyltransferase n=1 Tax=Paractinoplanes rishiriensis TaxID=1050105 RepID=A0A919N2C9_9ACTN|nr:GNAT family N-acetyltransferase [Actinoplanes rishiriensis]GIE99472.1 N-acetyltransferase [Actinoplanes rishiriensis]
MTTGNLDAPFHGDAHNDVIFVVRRTDHPDAARMLGAFYREQVGRYGYAESVDLDPNVYDDPSGIFLVIYRDSRPVGCGGCRRADRSRDTFEIKKTYLVPEARGCGLGHQLLEALERAAVAGGAHRIILETGIRNSAALRLFIGSGYTPMARYVAGRDPAINRAFEKMLTRSPQRLRTGDARSAIV